MQITLTKRDVEFAEKLVQSGHYPSVDAVVQAALADLRDTAEVELDDETLAAIQRADEQFERGEGIDFDDFVADFKKKLQPGK
jgi:Arc/MetJ-type ribon-helix-helix transcriptional regulator